MSSFAPSTIGETIYYTSASLSFLGCLVVFYGIYRHQESMSISIKLILFLNSSNFITSLVTLMNPLAGLGTFSCNTIGFLKALGGWTGLFWISLISLFAFMTFGGLSKLNFSKLFPALAWTCLIICFVIALIPVVKIGELSYTDLDGYCGLLFEPNATTSQKVLVSIFARILPYLVAVLITIIAYLKAARFFNNLTPETVQANDMNMLKLMMYPLAQILIYTPNTFSTIVLIWINNYTEIMFVIGTTCFNLCGFINFLVYGRQFLGGIWSKNKANENLSNKDSESSNSSLTSQLNHTSL